ncbi:MAG: rhodanese-related sulfurtransferase [Turneriella sp.]|nr:rhodanese-related sulfurtransferase [Turneriella sp.]
MAMAKLPKKEFLHNRLSREELLRRVAEEPPGMRTTLSFYRYTRLENLPELRDKLYQEWASLAVRGRIYLAPEGINAQLSVPNTNLENFRCALEQHPPFRGLRFNPGLEEHSPSFLKLTIKIKRYLVNDGLGDFFPEENLVAPHLPPLEFHQALDEPDTVVVDMRNFYESEVGRFDNAICPEVATFREELPAVLELLADKKDKKILLYCTGGIRCEKAGAYLKKHGFERVFQLEGGIINYVHAVRRAGIPSRFRGKNFVFDERLGERVTDDILARCHICGQPTDRQTNCANEACHALMVQCEDCAARLNNCCCEECRQVSLLPAAERRALRRADPSLKNKAWFSKRIRPRSERSQILQ